MVAFGIFLLLLFAYAEHVERAKIDPLSWKGYGFLAYFVGAFFCGVLASSGGM